MIVPPSTSFPTRRSIVRVDSETELEILDQVVVAILQVDGTGSKTLIGAPGILHVAFHVGIGRPKLPQAAARLGGQILIPDQLGKLRTEVARGLQFLLSQRPADP